FALAYLRLGPWWVFLGVMWTGAICGFISKVFFFHRINAVAVWSYVLLGWLPIVPALLTLGTVPLPALGWLMAGGLCYTLGTVFLMLDLQRFHFHAIWHMWVIGGSTCHFLGVLFFAAPLLTATPA
ncbi:MAG: hemolysin III family protein, partial [Pirellulaceae bacterium]|nr:hemolysin III family protein [Pirellulaceae bacterium]